METKAMKSLPEELLRNDYVVKAHYDAFRYGSYSYEEMLVALVVELVKQKDAYKERCLEMLQTSLPRYTATVEDGKIVHIEPELKL